MSGNSPEERMKAIEEMTNGLLNSGLAISTARNSKADRAIELTDDGKEVMRHVRKLADEFRESGGMSPLHAYVFVWLLMQPTLDDQIGGGVE